MAIRTESLVEQQIGVHGNGIAPVSLELLPKVDAYVDAEIKKAHSQGFNEGFSEGLATAHPLPLDTNTLQPKPSYIKDAVVWTEHLDPRPVVAKAAHPSLPSVHLPSFHFPNLPSQWTTAREAVDKKLKQRRTPGGPIATVKRSQVDIWRDEYGYNPGNNVENLRNHRALLIKHGMPVPDFVTMLQLTAEDAALYRTGYHPAYRKPAASLPTTHTFMRRTIGIGRHPKQKHVELSKRERSSNQPEPSRISPTIEELGVVPPTAHLKTLRQPPITQTITIVYEDQLKGNQRANEGTLSRRAALVGLTAGVASAALVIVEKNPITRFFKRYAESGNAAQIARSTAPEVAKPLHIYQSGETIAFARRPDLPPVTIDGWLGKLPVKKAKDYLAAHPDRTLTYDLLHMQNGQSVSQVVLKPGFSFVPGNYEQYIIDGDYLFLRGIPGENDHVKFSYTETGKDDVPLDADAAAIYMPSHSVDFSDGTTPIRMENPLELPLQQGVEKLVKMAKLAKLKPTISIQGHGQDARIAYHNPDTGEIAIGISEDLFTHPAFNNEETGETEGEETLYHTLMRGIFSQLHQGTDGTLLYSGRVARTALDAEYFYGQISQRVTDGLYKAFPDAKALDHPIFALANPAACEPGFFRDSLKFHPSLNLQNDFAGRMTLSYYHPGWLIAQGERVKEEEGEARLKAKRYTIYSVHDDTQNQYRQTLTIMQAIASNDAISIDTLIPSSSFIELAKNGFATYAGPSDDIPR